jgi:hypothetical protein
MPSRCCIPRGWGTPPPCSLAQCHGPRCPGVWPDQPMGEEGPRDTRWPREGVAGPHHPHPPHPTRPLLRREPVPPSPSRAPARVWTRRTPAPAGTAREGNRGPAPRGPSAAPAASPGATACMSRSGSQPPSAPSPTPLLGPQRLTQPLILGAGQPPAGRAHRWPFSHPPPCPQGLADPQVTMASAPNPSSSQSPPSTRW